VTDNAEVDADAIDVNAPATGTMTRWTVAEGQAVRRGQYLGRVALPDGGAQPQVVVKAPRSGTVAINDVVGDEYVTAGQTLAIAYDLTDTWITARVDESDVRRIMVGQPVDITIDAYPGVPMTGVISLIQAAAAGQFTPYPSTDVDPTDVQRIDQYIPVRIIPIYTGGKKLVPGMSATVHIRTSH
jgi:multidrug resistance efflux pump